MQRIPVKLSEMRDAKVQYISLVDKAASRLPFRIVKRDKDMSIDLSRIWKSDTGARTINRGEIAAVIVQKQGTEEADQQVREAVAASGYSVDSVIALKDDGEVVVFAQKGEDSLKDTVLVRLSDQALVAVKGFQPDHPELNNSGFADTASSKGFYQGFDSSLDTLFSKVCAVLQKSEDEAAAAKEIGSLIDGFKTYTVGLVKALPSAAFKADIAVQDVVEKMEASFPSTESAIDALVATAPEGSNWEGLTTVQKVADLMDTVTKKHKEPKKDEGDDKPSKPEDMSDEDWGKLSDDEKKEACKKAEEAKTAATKNETPAPVVVSDNTEVLLAIKGVLAEVKALDTRVTEIAQKAEDSKKVVDELASKQEDFGKRLASTVVGSATPEDAPSGGRVVKQEDNDPRTGFFDTGMMRSRGKNR